MDSPLNVKLNVQLVHLVKNISQWTVLWMSKWMYN